MDDSLQNTAQWARDAASLPLPEWDSFPNIPLYMDQVVLYLSDQLRSFQREGGQPLLTSSMVNNYVKNGAIPRPEKKKYDRRHLGELTALCMLKQVLPLQDIKTLLAGDAPAEQLYELFREVHRAAMEEVCAELDRSLQESADPRQEALRLAAEANAKRAAAEHILVELAKTEKAKNAEE